VVDSKDTAFGADAEPFNWAQPVNVNSTARVPIQRLMFRGDLTGFNVELQESI
jgi:hypothetical protein